MKRAAPRSPVDAYLESVPGKARVALKKIRALARKAAPGAVEKLSYGMPSVFLDGKVVAYFAAFKDHVGLYPPVRGEASLVAEAAPYAGPKGNLKFPLDAPMPYPLIRKVLRGHAESVRAASAARARRERHPMPGLVKKALAARGLTAAYRARPPYQQNDYLGWIANAKTPATQARRLAQMLDELERGGVYMRMRHEASARPGP